MTPLCYTGPFLDASGYGEATRNAIMALRAAGCDIKTQRISFTGNINYKTRAAKICQELESREVDYKIKIIHTTPDVYKNYKEQGKYHIGHLFWETDKLPRSWVMHCNTMDEIWTGTELNKKSIIDSGVNVPIYVFAQSIDTDIPDVRPYKLPNFNGFLFYSIFEWNERKDPKTLINAFWKEFKGDYNAGLLIKTHKSTYSADGVKYIVDEVNRWKNALGWKDTPRLFLHTNISDEEEKHRIHETGDCYVTSNRGEGWNIPIAEATLHRKPVISPKYGGIVEYFKAKEFYQVRHDLVPIDKIYGKYYEPNMNWAQVDEKNLREIMRKVYDYSLDEKKKGLSKIKASHAVSLVKMLFNYEMIGNQMHGRLKEIAKKL